MYSTLTFSSRQDADESTLDSGPVVRRPVSAAPKSKSKLRLSFNPIDNEGRDEKTQRQDDEEQQRPQSTNRSYPTTTLNRSSRDVLDRSNELLQDRPSYSKDYLQELKNSTPNTPKDLSTYNSSIEDDDQLNLDIATKFGEGRIGTSIPSAAEIREKKERRARLAKEQGAEDFISLEDYDSDGEFKPQRMQISMYSQRDQDRDTRLVREDEDIAEGFDEFVEDSGRVTLSKKKLREQSKKEREIVRNQIEEAEGSSEEDDSDAELNESYVAAQTSRGMDGSGARRLQYQKPKQPSYLAPIPKLNSVINRFRGRLQELEMRKTLLLKRKADVQKEKLEVATRQEHIQKLLSEAAEEFERLRAEMLESRGVDLSKVNGSGSERGLDSMGSTPGP